MSGAKMVFWLVVAIITLNFIPFPKLPLIHIAPINTFYYIGLIFLFLYFATILNFDYYVLIILLLLVSYGFVVQCCSLVKTGEFHDLYDRIRDIEYIFLILIASQKEEQLHTLVNIFIVLSFLSTVFGAMVYFIGGPFISLRSWLVQSMSTGSIPIGVSSQLTGLYSTPAIFGYVMASAPIVSYGIYQMTHNRWWLAMLLVLLLGLILNAERSALLMNVVVFYLCMRHTNKNPFKIIGFFLLVYCLMTGAVHMVKAFKGKAAHPADGALQHGTMMERLGKGGLDEAVNRIAWQVNGVRTVLRYPLLGATEEQYEATVRAGNPRSAGPAFGESIPYPHNHYLNTGLDAGVLGWAGTAALFLMLRKLHVKAVKKLAKVPNLWPLYASVGLGMLGAMGNGFFHNAGIFSGELASCTMLAFFLAFHQVLNKATAADDSRSGVRRPHADGSGPLHAGSPRRVA